MPVPDYQSLMLPTLKALSDGVETSISELRARIATAGGLTPEEASEKLPSGRQTVFANRVGWAVTCMEGAGLVQRVRRAVYRLTAEGERLLAREPSRVDGDVLRTYPAFVEWKDREGSRPPHIERPQPRGDESRETPEETLDRAAGELRAILEAEVLDRVRNTHVVLEGYATPDGASSTRHEGHWAAGPPRPIAVALPASVAEPPQSDHGLAPRRTRFLPLSGKSDGALRDMAGRYLAWLDEREAVLV